MKKSRSKTMFEDVQILGEKVLIHTNIVELENEDGIFYECNEETITKDEYIKMLREDNAKLWDVADYLLGISSIES